MYELQYIGDKNGCKLFLVVSSCESKLGTVEVEGVDTRYPGSNSQVLWLEDWGTFFTYCTVDGYKCHLPGYNFIKRMQIGEILPADGCVSEESLSDDDRALLNMSWPDKRRFFRAKAKERYENA